MRKQREKGTEKSIAGGIRAAAKIKKRDPLHYVKIGRLGGQAETEELKGFAKMKETDPERLSEIGRRGGQTSRRGGDVPS